MPVRQEVHCGHRNHQKVVAETRLRLYRCRGYEGINQELRRAQRHRPRFADDQLVVLRMAVGEHPRPRPGRPRASRAGGQSRRQVGELVQVETITSSAPAGVSRTAGWNDGDPRDPQGLGDRLVAHVLLQAGTFTRSHARSERSKDHRFFHRGGLDSSLDFDRLVGGEKVEFEITQSPKGPRAERVRALA